MAKQLRFDGKVAVVTGAGGGLGRSHALLLASRGAKVVVNDLGGSFKGDGSSTSAADKVVDEIKAAGGVAVANYDSVENGENIIKTAIDSFGRIDILINNAGILRDVSFAKMSQQDWDLIYKVHVYGSFKCTQAAWPYMRDQKFGRIIMTASAAGIYGNFGQANYSMAKLGLHGFTQTLALEGRKNNVYVNTIAPIAGSRMTETVLPPALLESLKPEYVSSLVGLLTHESCDDTGGLFEVGGGFYSKLRWQRTEGKTFRLGRNVSIEDVQANWDTIRSFDKSTNPDSVTSSMQPIMANVEAGPSRGGNEFIDVDAAMSYKIPKVTSQYDEKDLSLYALGVGAAANPLNDADLRLVYEMHGEGMKALPSFAVTPPLNAIFDLFKRGEQIPGLNFGLDRILHGEQYLELKRPMPLKAKLTHQGKVKEIYDKGKNAVAIIEFTTSDDNGEIAKNEITLFARGAGGWGGDRGPSAEINVPPSREPDARVEEKIPENQALLYRLSGDINPLHADPGFASAFGFERPILHGLCTFGYATRHILQKFAKDGNTDYFKSIKVRFADSVFPGETLVTEVWKESDTKLIFRCKVKERDKVVISNAALELYTEVPKVAAKPAASGSPSPSKDGEGRGEVPNSTDIFNAIGAYFKANPDLVGRVKTAFQFNLSNPSSAWTLDLKDKGTVTQGTATAQCTLELSDADFMAMCTGKANPMKLFSSGKLKISGDVMASQKLDFLKSLSPDLVIAEMKKRTGGTSPTTSPQPSPSADGEGAPTSRDLFAAIADHVSKHPEIAPKVGNVYLFKLSNPSSAWTMDLKNGAGAVTEGENGKPDCTLEMSDADFLAMATGKANPMKLFTSGKLKIGGNVMASQKLDAVLKGVDPKEAQAAVAKARASGAAAPAAASNQAAATKTETASKVFAGLAERFKSKPELAAEIGVVVQFNVTEPDASWYIDGKTVTAGKASNAVATVSIKDDDLAALASGKQSAQSLYQHGQLRIDGDASVGRRLGVFKGLL